MHRAPGQSGPVVVVTNIKGRFHVLHYSSHEPCLMMTDIPLASPSCCKMGNLLRNTAAFHTVAMLHTRSTLSHSSPHQVIIITGPTAVGKTAVGLELAKRLGGEVISADSVQVYRTLDVGSDKVWWA